MPGSSFLSVREAAELLGVSPGAVRRRIASDSLPAVKRGREWWIDRGDVERSGRQLPGPGRALSPQMAWAVLLQASGESDLAAALAGRDRYRSRVRAWLRDYPLAEYAIRVRHRARAEPFAVHPSELRRILSGPTVLATGLSASHVVGLVGGAERADCYAPIGRRAGLIAEHGLEPGRDAVQIRWVPDELWTLIAAGARNEAPRAAVLVDLLESDDPRARREAARAL